MLTGNINISIINSTSFVRRSVYGFTLIILFFLLHGNNLKGRDTIMPVYEFICLDCRKTMEKQASMGEKERGLKPVCPSCNSDNMTQYFGNMKVVPNYPLH